MNISSDKRWLILTIEESLLYAENRSHGDPFPESFDLEGDFVRIPYRFKDRMEELKNRSPGS